MPCCTRPPKRLPAIGASEDAATKDARTGSGWVPTRRAKGVRKPIQLGASSVPIAAASPPPGELGMLRGRREHARPYPQAIKRLVGAEVRPRPRPAERQAGHEIRHLSRPKAKSAGRADAAPRAPRRWQLCRPHKDDGC